MKIAIVSTDNREFRKTYGNPVPDIPMPQEALLQGFAPMPDLEIHFVSCLQQPVRCPEKLAPNIWYHGLHVPKSGWLRTGYQGCVRAVRQRLKKIRPDVVHGQGTERECAVSAVFSGFPNVLTIHGNMQSIANFFHARIGSFHWLAAKIETLTLKRTLGVFCNSAYTERLVAPRARRVWRVPNALRLPFFETPKVRVAGAQPVLLNVGVISPYKRQAEVLALARRLWERGFRFEMQFAGSLAAKTEYGAAFARQLAEAEAAGYARHLGLLGRDELIATFDAASALVHCPGEESFGLVVAEALTREVKLFGLSVGGVIDICSGVPGAELFPENDWMALENSIARWMQAGCPVPTGAAAIMRQRYHPDVVARQHLEVYREVLKTCS